MKSFCILVILLMIISNTAAQLRSIQSKPWQIYAETVIDLKCSDYIVGTRANDTYLWKGDYAFIEVTGNHLQSPINSKWRNIGRIQLTCTVSRDNHTRPVVSTFDIRFQPLSIGMYEKSEKLNNTYLLVIVGVVSSLTIIGCAILMVRQIKKTEQYMNPRLDLLADVIAEPIKQGYNEE